MGENMSRKGLARRQFLRMAAAAGLGSALPFAARLGAEDATMEEQTDPQKASSPLPDSSRAVIARSDAIRRDGDALKAEEVKKLLNEAVRRLTGGKTARDAWRGLFAPREKVTIKVSCLPGARLSSTPEVTMAVVDGLLSAGLNAENIVIWDRSDRELTRAGFELYDGSKKPRCFGTDHLPGGGYSRRIYTAGHVGSLFSSILTDLTDALVSLPVLKDHDLAGVSLSMKNFFGAIHNPNKYHDDHCDPFIAELAAHPLIRGKLRLVVTDGTLAQPHRGPAFAPQYAWNWNGLIVSRDPVAADAVGVEVIEKRRKALNLPHLRASGRPPVHVQTAERLGLGLAEMSRIERIEI